MNLRLIVPILALAGFATAQTPDRSKLGLAGDRFKPLTWDTMTPAQQTMVEHLQGKPVEKRVDTGATMVTPEKLDAPELQRLLHPPLAKYLGGT